MRSLATAGRVPDMNRAFEIELFRERRDISGICVHFIAFVRLAGAPMAPTIMGNDSIALFEKEEELVIPLVGSQWPTVMKHQRLRLARAPVLVKNACAILGGD